MEKEILNLIKKSKKNYDRPSKRAELLKRNKKFIEELREIYSQIGKQFFKLQREYVKSGKNRNFFKKHHEILNDGFEEWFPFCEKWHIDYYWDGQIRSLIKYIKKTLPIIPDSFIFREKEAKLMFEIDAWTSLDDIKEIWPRVKKLQNQYFSSKVAKKSNFGRDLVFYDLSNKYKLKPRRIAELWNEVLPDDIDLLVIESVSFQLNSDHS